MLKKYLGIFILSLVPFLPNVNGQGTPVPPRPALGFGSAVPVGATTGVPTPSQPLSFGPNVPSAGDPTAYTGNPADYTLGTPVGGSSGNTAPTPTPTQRAQAKQDEIIAAVQAYVVPTSTRNFSLGNLNSDNEASLIISSGNEENNVIFRVIRLIGMLIGTVAILLYIVAGYFMIFSQGSENQLNKGKEIVTFTSLGLVLAFGAYMIVQLVMGLIYFTT